VRKRIDGRKKQSRSVKIKLLLLFGGFFFGAVLLLSTTVGGKLGFFHRQTLDLLGPVQTVLSKVGYAVGGLKEKYLNLVNLKEENQRLRLMLDDYQKELDEYREGYTKFLHLHGELEFKKREKFPSITARVVGRDGDRWFYNIIIDRGKNDGVEEGMVARTSLGVVGQVIQVSKNYSKVLLANAPSSAIDAMIQNNRVRGILKGAGEKGYILHYVLKNELVEEGNQIVTAGIGGMFSSGIPLGVVSSIRKERRGMFQEIEVKPAIDFQKLEFLFIDISERQKIREEMNFHNSAPGNQ